MDKNDILDYVTETPHNTNRAVLSSMLNQLGGGGGGSEPLIVHMEEYDDWYRLDKTFGELINAMDNGISVVWVDEKTYGGDIEEKHQLLKTVVLSYMNGDDPRWDAYSDWTADGSISSDTTVIHTTKEQILAAHPTPSRD